MHLLTCGLCLSCLDSLSCTCLCRSLCGGGDLCLCDQISFKPSRLHANLLTGLLLLLLGFLGGERSRSESCALCFSCSRLRDSDILMTSYYTCKRILKVF